MCGSALVSVARRRVVVTSMTVSIGCMLTKAMPSNFMRVITDGYGWKGQRSVCLGLDTLRPPVPIVDTTFCALQLLGVHGCRCLLATLKMESPMIRSIEILLLVAVQLFRKGRFVENSVRAGG